MVKEQNPGAEVTALDLAESMLRFVPKQVSWFIAGSKEEGRRPKDVEVHDLMTGNLTVRQV